MENKTKISKDLLQEAMGEKYRGKEVKLYLSKKVFDYKELKPNDIRLLIVLSTLKGNRVEDMKHFKNLLIPWITKQPQSKSSKILNNSLIKLIERNLVDKEGRGLDLKKNYIIFTEKEYELLNEFNSVGQLFMISARIWNRNKINQIVPNYYLDTYLPKRYRPRYFKQLLKALSLDETTYGFKLEGNTFKKDLDNYTDREKKVILATKKEKYKEDVPIITETKKEESEGFKELMENKKEEEEEVEFPCDSKIDISDYDSTDFPY